jgi:hypothetical protein
MVCGCHCVTCLVGDAEKRRDKNKRKEIKRKMRRDAETAAETLTEILGVEHVVVETVAENGKKTFQPKPIKEI